MYIIIFMITIFMMRYIIFRQFCNRGQSKLITYKSLIDFFTWIMTIFCLNTLFFYSILHCFIIRISTTSMYLRTSFTRTLFFTTSFCSICFTCFNSKFCTANWTFFFYTLVLFFSIINVLTFCTTTNILFSSTW